MRRAPVPALLALLALAAPARAHRLNVEARVEGPQVRVEVYFSDGTTPAGAQVTVTLEGVEVARGETDAAGRWAFKAPRAGRYEVAVTEPGLHRARVEVVVREADVAVVESASASATAPTSASPTEPTSASEAAPTSASEAARPERGGVDWARTLVGLVVIAALAAGLGAWQRRRA